MTTVINGIEVDFSTIVTDIVEINAIADALLTLSATGGTLTASGAEQTLYRDDEPLGCTMGRRLYVDLDAMAGGDTTVIRVYYRLSDGGGLQLLDYASYTGADGGLANGIKLIAVDLGPYRHGIQVTLEQTAGVNRAYPFEFFAEV
ncbi:MAG: hypothetical protein KAJ19_26700 [Gammaproteobacteria bacterium]|nr:hypothetical protein [Gammaproteobacteria bacterium]